MKPIFTSLFFLVLLFAFVASGDSYQPEHNQPNNPDSFSVASIPFNCFWVNRPAVFKTRFDNDVEYAATKKTDLLNFADGTFTSNSAPMLLFYPDSDFVFTARVKVPCAGNYSGGALVVYTDENNWAKLLFEHSPNGEDAIWTGVTDVITDDNKNAVLNQKEVFLRIARKGVLYCFYYSKDGQKWEMIRAFGQNKLQRAAIGFLVQSPEEDSCTIPFSAIKYTGAGFNDFWSGN